MKMRSHRFLYRMFSPLAALLLLSLLLAFTGCGGAKSGTLLYGSVGHAHSQHRRDSRFYRRGSFLHVDRVRNERDHRNRKRIGWQQLHDDRDRRHASRHARSDRNLYRDRHRRRWQCIREGDRDRRRSGNHRDHCGHSRLHRSGSILHPDCDRGECNRREGLRFRWHQLYPCCKRRHAGRYPRRDRDLHRDRHRRQREHHLQPPP